MRPAVRAVLLEGALLLALGGFAALFLASTGALNRTAALFPRLVATACLVLLAVYLARWVLARGVEAAAGEAAGEEPGASGGWSAALALQAAYILAIWLVGFTVATVLFLLAAPLQMRYRRPGVVVAYAAALTALVSGSFLWVFHVRLPGGVLWGR
ncbi:MAG TPA: tripartite tricarboxylate transporter TctB family protein [Thermodesulfobacteriota bacterium]|nr:tripartite tricarboxylate transporter TctB family protein [Thermodesulfobacteriota bacterium]